MISGASVGEMNPGYPKEAHFFKLLKPSRQRRLQLAGWTKPAESGRLHLPGRQRPAGLEPDQPTDSSVLVGQFWITARTSCRASPIQNHDNELQPDQRVVDVIGIIL